MVLYSNQINDALSCNNATRSSFKGVYSRDTLPQNLSSLPSLIVANTDPSYLRGSHWVAIWISGKKVGYFFDSYGLAPAHHHKNFEDFMKENCTLYTHQRNQLQSQITTTCGEWCVYFGKVASSHEIEEISNHFTLMFDDNYRNNDDIVSNWFSRTFSRQMKKKSDCQCCKSFDSNLLSLMKSI